MLYDFYLRFFNQLFLFFHKSLLLVQARGPTEKSGGDGRWGCNLHFTLVEVINKTTLSTIYEHIYRYLLPKPTNYCQDVINEQENIISET